MPARDDAALPGVPGRVVVWMLAVCLTAWAVSFAASAQGAAWPLQLGLVVATTTTSPRAAMPVAVFAAATWLVGTEATTATLLTGALAAVAAGRSGPHPTDRVDGWLTAMAAVGIGGVGLGLVDALGGIHVVLGTAPTRTPMVDAAVVALGSALAGVPAAWRHDRPEAPGTWAVQRAPLATRATARHAAALAREASTLTTDVPTRRMLVEVSWRVLELLRRQHTAARALARLPQRGDLPPSAEAAEHAARVAAHRQTIERTQARQATLADVAVAGLEEARANLLARHLTGDVDSPLALEVLVGRLRAEERDHRARRDAQEELGGRTTAPPLRPRGSPLPPPA